MLTRIRLDAVGYTADDVERTLYPHADLIDKLLGREMARGECVIERDTNERPDTAGAWKGRLALYMPLSEPGVTVTVTGNASNAIVGGMTGQFTPTS